MAAGYKSLICEIFQLFKTQFTASNSKLGANKVNKLASYPGLSVFFNVAR